MVTFYLEKALAARRENNIRSTLEALAQAENEYQKAATASRSIHLDSMYNLGVCHAIRSNLFLRLKQPSKSRAAKTIAQQHFNNVLVSDTSGRSETLALANTSLASLLVQGKPALLENFNSCSKNVAEEAFRDLLHAINHVNAAISITGNLGDLKSLSSSHLQIGDLHALAMRWCLQSLNIAEAFSHCETACRHYDEGLCSPVPVDDMQFLEQKVRTLHGLCNWATENGFNCNEGQYYSQLTKAIDIASETVKAIVALVPSGGGKHFAELLVVCGDICEMNQNFSEALRLYQNAVSIAPIADAYAGAAEILLNEGRTKIKAPAAEAEVAAVKTLRHSVEAWKLAAQIEPSNNVYIYNFACANALILDEDACMQALLELKKKRTAGDLEAATLLSETEQDQDFDRVRKTSWFVQCIGN